MGQQERHQGRTRHIYALIFKDKHCYVGQTNDLERRKSEHMSERGGWREPFEMIHLDTMKGTREEAEDYEYAWRYTAQRKGWSVIGKPPKVVVNSSTHMTIQRHRIAKKKRWPRNTSDSLIWNTITFTFGFIAITTLLLSLHFVF
ncbi:GIY-YIG nuclease family protein [Stenotrophomonas acidaminiphila]